MLAVHGEIRGAHNYLPNLVHYSYVDDDHKYYTYDGCGEDQVSRVVPTEHDEQTASRVVVGILVTVRNQRKTLREPSNGGDQPDDDDTNFTVPVFHKAIIVHRFQNGHVVVQSHGREVEEGCDVCRGPEQHDDQGEARVAILIRRGHDDVHVARANQSVRQP